MDICRDYVWLNGMHFLAFFQFVIGDDGYNVAFSVICARNFKNLISSYEFIEALKKLTVQKLFN